MKMKQSDNSAIKKISQEKSEELIHRLLNKLEATCVAMINTIDAYRHVYDSTKGGK